jgi:hypothetical protein
MLRDKTGHGPDVHEPTFVRKAGESPSVPGFSCDQDASRLGSNSATRVTRTRYVILSFYMLQSPHHLDCKQSQTHLFGKEFGTAAGADDDGL